MLGIAQKIPKSDCWRDTVHPAGSPETLDSFRISVAVSRQQISRGQPQSFVLRRPFDRRPNIVATRSWESGRVARGGIAHAFPYRRQRASRSPPSAPQHQWGADAICASGQPACEAAPLVGAIS